MIHLASSVAPYEAAEHFSWLGHFVSLDSPASSSFTRELLGGSRPDRG